VWQLHGVSVAIKGLQGTGGELPQLMERLFAVLHSATKEVYNTKVLPVIIFNKHTLLQVW